MFRSHSREFLLGFTEFDWVLLGFTGFYWVLLGFTEFYWVLASFRRFRSLVNGIWPNFGTSLSVPVKKKSR